MDKTKITDHEENLSTQEEIYMKHIKEHILHYLNDHDMTMQELSDLTDISYSNFNNALYTKRKDAKLCNVVKYCKATHTSIDELLDIGTMSDDELSMLNRYRKLNSRSKYVINWMMEKEIAKLEHMNTGRYINVFTPIISNDGSIKPSNQIEMLDITHIPSDIRVKIFTGLRLSCDYYMPLYTPTDILLIANDRMPRPHETCLIVHGGTYFLCQRKGDKYYSIRDNQFRSHDSEIDRYIGYVAYVIE